MDIFKKMDKKFSCRSEELTELIQLIESESDEILPSCIFVYGHSGTGKTAIIKEYMRHCVENENFRVSYLNCVEAYTTRIFFEHILEEITGVSDNADEIRCENLSEFIGMLRKEDLRKSFIIVLDSAERLRDMDANILPSFLRLQELTGLNICIILISQLPLEKHFCKTGIGENVHVIHFPQYSKTQTQRILSGDLENVQRILCERLQESVDMNKNELERRKEIIKSITLEFFNNYLNLFLSVFFKACRDVPELKITARKCFGIYIAPVLDGTIDAGDVSRLWRHVAEPLRTALAQVYMRYDNAHYHSLSANTQLLNPSIRKQAQSLELPYYAKYLLIAAFIASHNSAKDDKRLFVKHHGKQRKRMQSVNAKAKVSDKMSTSIGPKSFTIDRLLAIFYAILEEKVGLTCNLLSQISTLVHLKFLNFVSGENNIMDGSARLQCMVNLEFVLYIGKMVDFNVRQYLCDFM